MGAWIETEHYRLNLKDLQVAPYVGAWIETQILQGKAIPVNVAPYVGAWIETCTVQRDTAISGSHPMWVRGLKLL